MFAGVIAGERVVHAAEPIDEIVQYCVPSRTLVSGCNSEAVENDLIPACARRCVRRSASAAISPRAFADERISAVNVQFAPSAP